MKNELPCAVIGRWIRVGSVYDSRYGVLDSLREYESTQWAAFVIPIAHGVKFRASVRVKLNFI